MLLLIICIIKEEKEKWVTLCRRNVIDPTLDLEKILKEDLVNTKFETCTSSREHGTISSQKNKPFCLLINRIVC